MPDVSDRPAAGVTAPSADARFLDPALDRLAIRPDQPVARDVLGRWFGKDVPPGHGRELGLFVADLPNYGIAPYHNGSMASWIPSGAGFALAFKYRKEPRVYVALTGDGATSPGDFYEGLNFAAIHKLPL